MNSAHAISSSSARAETLSQGRPRPLAFVREFVRAPKELGTCFTSSPALSRALIEGMNLERARCAVELGPGTGPLTEQVLRRIPRDCTFFAVERNAGLTAALRQRWPLLRVYNDDAANLGDICRREEVTPGTVDAVISSLPYLLLPEREQARLIHAAAGVLRPGGTFCCVTYRPELFMPSVRRFRRRLAAEFSSVRLAKIVLRNFPPAFVYRCVR